MVNVLTSQVRQQLEQERTRLSQQRDRLVKQAIAKVETEFETTIASLNALLDGSSRNAKKPTAATTAIAKVETGGIATKGRKAAGSNQKPAVKPVRGTTTKAKSKLKAGGTFNVQTLKAEFSNMTANDAIIKVINASPKKVFTTEDILAAVYPPISEGDVPNARKSIGVVLSWATRRGNVVRVQKTPATFQAKK
jgi:hypothetical protein